MANNANKTGDVAAPGLSLIYLKKSIQVKQVVVKDQTIDSNNDTTQQKVVTTSPNILPIPDTKELQQNVAKVSTSSLGGGKSIDFDVTPKNGTSRSAVSSAKIFPYDFLSSIEAEMICFTKKRDLYAKQIHIPACAEPVGVYVKTFKTIYGNNNLKGWESINLFSDSYSGDPVIPMTVREKLKLYVVKGTYTVKELTMTFNINDERGFASQYKIVQPYIDVPQQTIINVGTNEVWNLPIHVSPADKGSTISYKSLTVNPYAYQYMGQNTSFGGSAIGSYKTFGIRGVHFGRYTSTNWIDILKRGRAEIYKPAATGGSSSTVGMYKLVGTNWVPFTWSTYFNGKFKDPFGYEALKNNANRVYLLPQYAHAGDNVYIDYYYSWKGSFQKEASTDTRGRTEVTMGMPNPPLGTDGTTTLKIVFKGYSKTPTPKFQEPVSPQPKQYDQNKASIAGENKSATLTKTKTPSVVITRQTESTVDETFEIDFGEIASKSNFGFGIERFDQASDTKKTVQQTKGLITGDDTTNNTYVDSWWTAPTQLILAGVIEMPYAYTDPVVNWMKGEYNPNKNDKDKVMSFVDGIEKFLLWNSHPIRLARGDKLYVYDYAQGQMLDVAFKNFNIQASVERQNLLRFDMNFIVLSKTPMTNAQNNGQSDVAINSNIFDQITNAFTSIKNQFGV